MPLMDRETLERRLRAEGFRADAYDFVGDDTANETLVLRPEGKNWIVYYAERGLMTGKTLFPSEAHACEYLLETLRNDPTSRGSQSPSSPRA